LPPPATRCRGLSARCRRETCRENYGKQQKYRFCQAFTDNMFRKNVSSSSVPRAALKFFAHYHATLGCTKSFSHRFAPPRKILHSIPIDAARARTHNARNPSLPAPRKLRKQSDACVAKAKML